MLGSVRPPLWAGAGRKARCGGFPLRARGHRKSAVGSRRRGPRPQREGVPAAPGDVVTLGAVPVRGKVSPPDTAGSGRKGWRKDS